jgi:hypothetical protein
MKCPNCDVEIGGVSCESCGSETPQGSLFCYKCGAEVPEEEDGLDFESRVLCSDETCTGVINESGVCGVCGKPPDEEHSPEEN